jgi:hypothetical protein
LSGIIPSALEIAQIAAEIAVIPSAVSSFTSIPEETDVWGVECQKSSLGGGVFLLSFF